MDALKQADSERILVDYGVSATRASRPELDRMLDHSLPGQDEMVVSELDRLGRNTRNLLVLIYDLESQGIHFRSLTVGIATTDPMGMAKLKVISAFAQLGRDQLAQRSRAGLGAVAANGRPAGRREITADHVKMKRSLKLNAQGIKSADIGKDLGDHPRHALQVPELRTVASSVRVPSHDMPSLMHDCDEPTCVHASADSCSHLMIGNHRENMLDRTKNRRHSNGNGLRYWGVSRAAQAERSRRLRDELLANGWNQERISAIRFNHDPDTPTLF